MKRTLFTIVLAFVFFFVNAQTSTNQPSAKVLHELSILKTADLNLSDVQIERITAVLSSQDQIYQKNMKVLEGNKSLLAQRIKELKEIKINNVKGALTEKQVEKFNALKLADQFE